MTAKMVPLPDYTLPDNLGAGTCIKRIGKNELFQLCGTSRRDTFGQKLFRLFSLTAKAKLRNFYSRDDLQEHGFHIVATPEG